MSPVRRRASGIACCVLVLGHRSERRTKQCGVSAARNRYATTTVVKSSSTINSHFIVDLGTRPPKSIESSWLMAFSMSCFKLIMLSKSIKSSCCIEMCCKFSILYEGIILRISNPLASRLWNPLLSQKLPIRISSDRFALNANCEHGKIDRLFTVMFPSRQYT